MTTPPMNAEQLRLAINLRLGLLGCSPVSGSTGADFTSVAAPLFAQQREITRRLTHQLPPVDERIQHFLNTYLVETGPAPRLPARTFVLDQAGLARELSLPADGDTVDSPLLKSYRLHNGVLHNPANDRRTTQGVFHVAEGGLPIPDDKLAVPVPTFARMLGLPLRHPPELLRLPYTANQKNPAECIVSLMLRPLVVPAVPGFIACQPVGYHTPADHLDFTSLEAFPLALDPHQLPRAAMADYAREAQALGVNYIGSCCGSVACHVRAMADALGKPGGIQRDWRSATGKPMSAVEYYEKRG